MEVDNGGALHDGRLDAVANGAAAVCAAPVVRFAVSVRYSHAFVLAQAASLPEGVRCVATVLVQLGLLE